MQTPCELLGGEEGIRRLAKVFYEVMDELPQLQTIRHMHAANLESIQQKLFEYLSGWLGGPHLYQQKYGTVCLTKPHTPYAIGPAERISGCCVWRSRCGVSMPAMKSWRC
jgi:hemoglobin